MVIKIIPSRTCVPPEPVDFRRHLKKLSETMSLEEIASRINKPIEWIKELIK